MAFSQLKLYEVIQYSSFIEEKQKIINAFIVSFSTGNKSIQERNYLFSNKNENKNLNFEKAQGTNENGNYVLWESDING